jgi:hypothetical protein
MVHNVDVSQGSTLRLVEDFGAENPDNCGSADLLVYMYLQFNFYSTVTPVL